MNPYPLALLNHFTVPVWGMVLRLLSLNAKGTSSQIFRDTGTSLPEKQVLPVAGSDRAWGGIQDWEGWCRRPDSNRYGLPHTPLKRARLPIPPLRHKEHSSPTYCSAGGRSAGACG